MPSGYNEDDITIVTAFLDLGSFQKGSGNLVYTLDTYFNWAKTFQFLTNPLIVYTDSIIFLRHMTNIRSDLIRRTKLILIQRNSLWAFQRVESIRKIFNTHGYPKFYPNTVIPEYSAAQHAKYEFMTKAAKANYFNTTSLAWLDIGYFRKELSSPRYFRLLEPPKFNREQLAFNLVYDVDLNVSCSKIFKENLVWVGGGLVLGKMENLILFHEYYRNAVDYFISMNLMNTDQQVIYAMFSEEGKRLFNHNVSLQLYYWHDDFFCPLALFHLCSRDEMWFYLGYKMRYTENSVRSHKKRN